MGRSSVIYWVPSEKAVVTHNAMRNKSCLWNPPWCVLLNVESCSLISILHSSFKKKKKGGSVCRVHLPILSFFFLGGGGGKGGGGDTHLSLENTVWCPTHSHALSRTPTLACKIPRRYTTLNRENIFKIVSWQGWIRESSWTRLCSRIRQSFAIG